MIYASIDADMLSRSNNHILRGRDEHYRSILREAVLYPDRYGISVGRASKCDWHGAAEDEEKSGCAIVEGWKSWSGLR
jgi:hypothetical protein